MPVKRNILLQYYQIFCNLSLDVVIGISINALAIGKVFHINAPLAWYVVLPLATWLVYLFDHLVDIKRNPNTREGSAHRFIQQHQWLVWVIIGLVCLAMGYFTWTDFNWPLFLCGATMVMLAGIHLLLSKLNPTHKHIFNNKEFGVAFIYATSLFIFPLYALFNDFLFDALLHHYLLFLLLAYQNLLLCSLIEYPLDVRMNNTSLIRAVGRPRGKLIFIGVSLGAASFLMMLLWQIHLYSPLLLGLYFMILAGNVLIYLWNEKLQQQVLYRKLADLLFWLPVLSLIF
jgi:hypothetical protein